MDYRHISIDTLTEFAVEFPNMSLGEMLYSTLRAGNLGKEIKALKDLREIDDVEMYTAIEKAMKNEGE